MSTVLSLVTSYRGRLDDLVEDYAWSNDELTDYMNDAIVELCHEVPSLIEDTSSAARALAVIVGSSTLSLSSSILKVVRAKLNSQDAPLLMRTATWMDTYYPGWESEGNSEPTILITEGVGSGKVRLYPPSNATDTLYMTVYRLPTDMVYATDLNNSPEIPAKFHRFLIDGVLTRAYSKQDTDTVDLRKADRHQKLWEDGIEKVKRAMLFERRKNEVMIPMV